MGKRQGMPPRGDELRKQVAEAVKNIDYREEFAKKAKEERSKLPPVHKDPPYRPEEER